MHADGSLRYKGQVVVGRFERGDPHGVSLLSFYCASMWHEEVSRSTSPVLLEWDEETRRRFRSMMSHMSTSKG